MFSYLIFLIIPILDAQITILQMTKLVFQSGLAKVTLVAGGTAEVNN